MALTAGFTLTANPSLWEWFKRDQWRFERSAVGLGDH